jgi:hypothetical protein
MNGRQQERHKRNNIIYIEYGRSHMQVTKDENGFQKVCVYNCTIKECMYLYCVYDTRLLYYILNTYFL